MPNGVIVWLIVTIHRKKKKQDVKRERERDRQADRERQTDREGWLRVARCPQIDGVAVCVLRGGPLASLIPR